MNSTVGIQDAISKMGAFFAGFGIMCAGAPGAAHFIGLASQAIQKLF